MTKEQEKYAEWAVGGVVAFGLGWLLFRLFGQGSGALPVAEAGTPAATAGESLPAISTVPFGPPASATGQGCGCGCSGGGDCAPTPNTIPTMNQILQQGTDAANQIYAFGNATLQAMADAYNEENPLLKITVG
jgi:hypothetical protein